jgi:hypothetical protein
MSTSQFKIFSSGDVGAPQLNGLSGSLLNVLEYCLVTGSGWLQPYNRINNLDVFQQPSGSKCILYVNDNNPSDGQLGRESWVTGWETLTTMSAPCGTGSTQFPTPAQSLTSGHFIVRKSSTNDRTTRCWLMFADAYTFYFFSLPEDVHNCYSGLFFGDFFSPRPDIDTNRCFLWARNGEGVTNNGLYDQTDTSCNPISVGGATTGCSGVACKTVSGTYSSAWIGKLGDISKHNSSNSSYTWQPTCGDIPLPNPFNNDIIVTPLLVWESGNCIRGNFRGMYYLNHFISQFYDGQKIIGSNENNGKTFQIVTPGLNFGMWAIETSNTVETN